MSSTVLYQSLLFFYILGEYLNEFLTKFFNFGKATFVFVVVIDNIFNQFTGLSIS